MVARKLCCRMLVVLPQLIEMVSENQATQEVSNP